MKPYYEKDGITIYHGDCRGILPDLPKVDLVLTDPPYGIGEAAGKNKSRGCLAVSRDYGKLNWDDTTIEDQLMNNILQYPYVIVWGGNYYRVPPSSCWLVWDKDNGQTDFADCELAWTNLSRAVRKFKWRWQCMLQERGGDKKDFRQHPTQKPIALMRWCISLTDATTILDPFMGSGTTLLAAKKEGCEAIGIEIEERYCEIAANRLRQGVLPFGDDEPRSDIARDIEHNRGTACPVPLIVE